jgi:hypothetical protein
MAAASAAQLGLALRMWLLLLLGSEVVANSTAAAATHARQTTL